MGEIIRTWMRTRLGVIIDLSPDIFGHYARDGTLLAKLLHSYDIINDSQLSTLNRTQDPALARVNLKNLRIWLRFVGVDCDDECIEEISNGKGTTSLRLFYKVFLCLENKDTLHFITLQKEREKYIPNSSKFDVTTVSEDPEPWAPDDHPLDVPLKKNANLVDWHRKKYRELIQGCKKKRDKFRSSQERNESRRASSVEEKTKFTPSEKKSKTLIEDIEAKELDEFAVKHGIKPVEITDSCRDIRTSTRDGAQDLRFDEEAAKAFTESLKSKRRREAVTKNFESRMQKTFLSELWEQVLSDQEMELDEMVARKVLNQSQYEKQLMRKLCDIRREKSRMSGNRRIVEQLSRASRESEERLEQDRAKEVLARESEEVEAETRRMRELERRIKEEAARKKRLKLRRIGEEVVDDLIDISVRAAEYKIASDEDEVPIALWNRWKALFVKSQPIIGDIATEFADRPEIDEDDIDEENEADDVYDEMDEDIDSSRNDVLNDHDFEDYHNLRSPWDKFVPKLDAETREFLNLGLIVVGYIVHKMLEKLEPRSREIAEPSLPKMKIRAVILGIPDSLLYEPIQELLRNSRVHLVRLEEAINHCLERYKTEMRDVEYIDLNIIAATEASSKRRSSAEPGKKKLKKEESKSASSRGKTASSSQRKETLKTGVDKLTQTPRAIPYDDMDPSLTDTAYIGKWTYEFLTLGSPLSDDLIARILVEYLKSLKDLDGFVLANYPNSYRQMKSLEFALTGRKLPDDDDDDAGGKFAREGMNIEEIKPISSRISFESKGNMDTKDRWSRSRLVPNPLECVETLDRDSHITAFIRIKPKPEGLQSEDVQRYEVLPEDATSLDAFFVEQDIASILYYKIFDLTTLKRLVRLALDGGEETLSRISSGELFGEAMETFVDRRPVPPAASEAPIVKKLLSRMSDYSLVASRSSEWTERSDEIVEETATISSRSKDGAPRPGDADWSWTISSQPPQLVEALVALWKSLENSYIDNLKDSFHLKRTNFEAVVPYANFVTKHMKEYIRRPDAKQDLLHEFHRDFNDTRQESRENLKVKHELHCRIADFQRRLWEICNLRRREAEDERCRIILDHWTTQESMILANVYIGIVQAEIDRCTDSLQLIQDYYLSAIGRRLQELGRFRVVLRKISFEISASCSKEEILPSARASLKSVKDKVPKETKAKLSNAKIAAPPLPAEESLFKEEMAKLLTTIDEETPDPLLTVAHKTVEDNIRYARTIVESMTSTVLEVLKKEEANAAKSPVNAKVKKRSSSKSGSLSAEQVASKKRDQDSILEWRYAVMFEISRIRLRLKILEDAARADINHLVEKMQRVFFGIRQWIIDRFEREMKSVDAMASTFGFAVEEETPIQKELLLDGDRFVVRSNVLMFQDEAKPSPASAGEEIHPARFQMAQLGRLVDIFHRVAPIGTLPERSFVYILQDLIACGDDDYGNAPLPLSWLQLRPCDVTELVFELFGDASYVDWREFIVNAMEIEPPSVDQLLDTLKSFRKLDKDSTDVIREEDFQSVGLWFFDGTNGEAAALRYMLHGSPEEDDEDMQDRNDYPAATKLGRIGNSRAEEEIKSPDKLRLALAKQLLCDMFLSKSRIVSYVALLLAFCKDDDPKIGLAKALSLATGNKICMDSIEGENYVQECLEKRNRASEAREYRYSLRVEAEKTVEDILEAVLERVPPKRRSIEAVEDIHLLDDDYEETAPASIQIEQLDEPGEIADPADSLIPDEPRNVSLTEKAEKSQIGEKMIADRPGVTIVLPEESDGKDTENSERRKIVYWLSLDVCQSVLAATLPKHAIDPDLLETGKGLRANLEDIYADLRIEELNVEAGLVLAHRFLEHSFVKKLLGNTCRFTVKRLGSALNAILRKKP